MVYKSRIYAVHACIYNCSLFSFCSSMSCVFTSAYLRNHTKLELNVPWETWLSIFSISSGGKLLWDPQNSGHKSLMVIRGNRNPPIPNIAFYFSNWGLKKQCFMMFHKILILYISTHLILYIRSAMYIYTLQDIYSYNINIYMIQYLEYITHTIHGTSPVYLPIHEYLICIR